MFGSDLVQQVVVGLANMMELNCLLSCTLGVFLKRFFCDLEEKSLIPVIDVCVMCSEGTSDSSSMSLLYQTSPKYSCQIKPYSKF